MRPFTLLISSRPSALQGVSLPPLRGGGVLQVGSDDVAAGGEDEAADRARIGSETTRARREIVNSFGFLLTPLYAISG